MRYSIGLCERAIWRSSYLLPALRNLSLLIHVWGRRRPLELEAFGGKGADLEGKGRDASQRSSGTTFGKEETLLYTESSVLRSISTTSTQCMPRRGRRIVHEHALCAIARAPAGRSVRREGSAYTAKES